MQRSLKSDNAELMRRKFVSPPLDVTVTCVNKHIVKSCGYFRSLMLLLLLL